MATPSSSATTPSPRMPYLAASPAAPPAPSTSRESSATIKEERQRAIQKFFANAELSQLARGLRTRLSYASFKAINNITHTTLPDLEAQAQNQAASSKSSANKSSSGHTTAQGGSANAQGSSSRGLTRKGTMPPPPPVTASATQSLFSSLLQPPPSKRARTIHNPEDPPVPPPTKPKPPTPSRKSPGKATRPPSSSGTTSKPKSRKDTKGKKKETGSEAGPSSRLLTPQSTLGSEGFVENDDDMKAAATLTSLLLSRPSISGSAGSPRSSLSGASEAGSAHSFSHYAQSSTRTTAPSSTPLAHEGTFPGSFPRSKTPPADVRHARTQSLPHVSNYSVNGNTTPKAQPRPGSRLAGSNTPHAPTDTEAADLMLFLATSPSPARPGTSKDKDSKDMAAFRTLGGQSTLKGRVLFPASGSTHDDHTSSGPRPLRRDPTGSFSSTLSVATELIDEPGDGSHEHLIGIPLPSSSSPLNPHAIKRSRSDSTTHLDIPAPPTIIPPTPTDDMPTPLLPPPSSPGRTPRPRAVSENAALERSASIPASSEAKGGSYAPPTPGNVPFNFNEFINVSPSPAAQASSGKLTSLRANVGRKLFEEHQGVSGNAGDRDHGGPGSLGAGIDLLKSSV